MRRAAAFLGLLLLAGGLLRAMRPMGEIANAQILPARTCLYTQRDMQEAEAAVMDRFRRDFPGMSLLALRYPGDRNCLRELAEHPNAGNLRMVLFTDFGPISPGSTSDRRCIWLLERRKGRWRVIAREDSALFPGAQGRNLPLE